MNLVALLAAASLTMVGGFAATTSTTAPTSAPAAVDWPGTSPARVADVSGALGGNISGLAVAGPAALWAVRDAPGELLALDRAGATWVVRAGWGQGRALRYPDGHAGPDAEAVTTVDGDAGAVYVGAERDNSSSSQPRNSVLRYEVAGTGPMQATSEWRLDELFAAAGANTGIEGLTWIADDVLAAAGLRDRTGRAYVPGEQPPHRGGLFVVATEQRAELLVVMLTDDGRASLVASIASGLPTVMELHWSAEHRELWAVCDDTCDGAATLLRPRDGAFEVVALVRAPARSDELNDEGFARLPCRDAEAVVVWADDLATGGHVLRESAVPCTSFAAAIGAQASVPGAAATGQTTAPAAPSTSAPNSTAATGATGEDARDDGGSDGRTAIVLVVVVAALAVAAAVGLHALRRRH